MEIVTRFFRSALLFVFLLSFQAVSIANPSKLWVNENTGVFQINTETEQTILDLDQTDEISAFDVDAESGNLWTLKQRTLRQYSATGSLSLEGQTPIMQR